MSQDPDGEFFQHPSWPERWSHPEVAGSYLERRARWKEQDWFHDFDRTSVRFLREIKWPWGFIIYRTVYTPQSDKIWSACLEKIEESVRYEIDRHGKEYADKTPERILKETLKNVILEDRERWDGASVKQIRADFIAHLESIGCSVGEESPRSTVCMMIDEACLQSIQNTFDEPENNRGSWAPTGFVGIVDPQYVEGESYCNMQYRGFMRAEIDSLYDLAARQLNYFTMHDICPIMYIRPRVVDPTKIPLYTGL
ncbi:hypothetical protein N7507_009170 [Penicillium longicatenatum]|nr:hypothetical protein N7507_009170 [Penicillium longicatenatum]